MVSVLIHIIISSCLNSYNKQTNKEEKQGWKKLHELKFIKGIILSVHLISCKQFKETSFWDSSAVLSRIELITSIPGWLRNFFGATGIWSNFIVFCIEVMSTIIRYDSLQCQDIFVKWYNNLWFLWTIVHNHVKLFASFPLCCAASNRGWLLLFKEKMRLLKSVLKIRYYI